MRGIMKKNYIINRIVVEIKEKSQKNWKLI